MRRLLLPLIPFVLLLTACSKKEEKSDSISSLGPYAEYINSISSGIISKTDPFVIELKSEVEGVKAGDELSSSYYDISPSVDAKAIWTSPSSIVITPEKYLESNKEYTISLELTDLISVPEELANFSFNVKTIPLSYAVELHHLSNTDENDFSKVALKGSLNASDWIDKEKVNEVVKANFNGKDLDISWTHGANSKEHEFTIQNITRVKEDKDLVIEWDGTPIGIKESGSTNYQIPSVDSFKIMSANVKRDGEAYISLVFSDPILNNQDFNTYVEVKRFDLSFTVDNNELKIFGKNGSLHGELDITVHKNLKNSKGLGLDKESQYSLQVSTFKPQVKLMAGQGNILPSTNELVLPIRVVGLKAIEVEVVKIFPNNMGQYFQDNELGGTYRLRRVGRPVVRKIIPLVKAGITDYYDWSKISLDLKDLFEAEKGAFYQVNIDFTKDMAVYNCEGMSDEADIEEYTYDPKTVDWDNNRNRYYGEYDWNERDNPCHDMYYRSNTSVSKMLFASDIGLTAKKAENNKLHVLSTDIPTTDAVESVNLKLYDYQNQLISEGKTDASGMAELPLHRQPFLLVAEKEKEFAYLKLEDGDALSLSNFDVSGATAKEGLKGFIYGERGVWRPGDTLNLSFILEDTYQRVPEGQKVVLDLFNPQGQLYKSYLPYKKEGPIYSFRPSTSSESPTGNWFCKVRAGSAEFTKNIKIETIKPNRLKIDVDFGKEILKQSEGNYANLSVRWMHGAVARNLKADFDIFTKATKTSFKDFYGYNFDDPGKEFYTDSKKIFESRINEKGEASFPIKVENKSEAPGMLRLVLNGKVFEEGGDFSIHTSSVLYSPYKSYVGINVPSVEENSAKPVLYTGKNNSIQLVNVDEEGNKTNNKSVTVELYKLEWRWWWDYGDDNISNYVSSRYNNPKKTYTVNLENGQKDWNLNIDNDDWGRYFIRIKDNSSGHSTGEVVYFRRSDWYGTMAKEMGGANVLNFSLSKEEAQVGEEVAVKIPSSGVGHAYVTVETGKALIQKEYISLEDQETIYKFTLSEEMAPNIYVHVSLIQPHGNQYNDLPLRMYGVRNVMVENKATLLEPEVQAPKNAQPKEIIQLTVNEKNGKPMAYTIALVDEGLLGLTNYKTPQPWDHFYAREALGVRTYDMFEDVLGSFAGKYGRLLAVGGDEMGPMEEKSESRFKPVVEYLGPFYLDKGDKRTHTVTIPQYIGELRMMLVAADKSGTYGSFEKSISINQPLMMLATLPRVMGPGETTKMPITLFANDPSIKTANVKVSSTGKLKSSKEMQVKLNPDSETIVYVDVEAEKALGSGKVHITATSGKNKAVYDVNMDVRPSNPRMISVKDKLLEDQETWTADYQPLGMLGTNESVLELSTLPPLNLDQRTSYLIRYPHGCIEQTTSSVFAQLYLSDLISLKEEKKYEIQRNIEAAIERLRNFQLPSGGFSYWPGMQTANEWGTSYAGHFLVEAQSRGYAVPKDMLRNFQKFQSEMANNWNSSTRYRSDLYQAYRLYTLALAGEPDMAPMNRMRENTGISELSKWLLANAYAQSSYQDVGEEMITNLTKEVKDYRELSGTFGSSTRDEAIILETLVKLGRKKDAFDMLQGIAEKLGDSDYWMSTQTTAYCLIAVAEYTKGFPASGNLNASVKIDEQVININQLGYFTQVNLLDADKSMKIEASNKSGAPLYVRLIRQGIPLEGGEKSDAKNLSISVNYYDNDGAQVDIKKMKQGTDFKAIVTVKNPGTKGELKELALTQIFPSGWEILNTRLNDTGAGNQDKAKYKDIRDDRVLTYFDLKAGEQKSFTVLLNASYKGRYYLPSVQAEAMYDNSIYANLEGKWVEVVD
ncbi:hypothetical protein MATR_19860 [Marivirga tractuosa]|uniref:Alpha-2-macroglobulin domain protein n=1 Tax=Marivirga tractuosa (strain ATCC 23168 / DSM 4126 / NBRC 15989 / NCIMB 1408 / VKM B-1430 / H-43) TaxID=643867 RepID=E4TND8_MARTH|nr:MG2 domain-containing protein [Marivirga tractuosa]ADR20395.1 alpha-2-macroglobulin domain protein [Marivirga tractuosa DSM 4126]BDD15161.1 hypothetical protein MATR_19860 [Marivirga tractuosa]